MYQAIDRTGRVIPHLPAPRPAAGFGSMVSNCKVSRRGLRDCLHDGVGATAECRSHNVAGVICGTDPATVPNQVRATQPQSSTMCV